MVVRIKTIKGRQYQYEQTSQRVGGKVKTTTKYLGPVTPKRRIGLQGILGGFLKGGAHLGALAVVGKAETKHHKAKVVPYDRAGRLLDDKVRALGPKFTVEERDEEGRRVGRFPSVGAKAEYVAEMKKINATRMPSTQSHAVQVHQTRAIKVTEERRPFTDEFYKARADNADKVMKDALQHRFTNVVQNFAAKQAEEKYVENGPKDEVPSEPTVAPDGAHSD